MPNDGIAIPASRRSHCAYCAMLVDTSAVGVWELATGWIENRRKGGSNAIALPVRKGRYACNVCIDRMRHGISPNQQTLFEQGLTDAD